MVAILIDPRVENVDNDTESIVSGARFRIWPSEDYTAGGQTVLSVPPATWKTLNGAAVTVQLDSSNTISYTMELWVPDSRERNGMRKSIEYRLVKTTTAGGTSWFALDRVSAPPGNAAYPASWQSTADALQAQINAIVVGGGGASTLSQITDMSAFMRTVNDDANASTARTTLGAAASADPTITGTASLANLSVSGTVAVPDNSLTISDTTGLQTALDAKVSAASPTLTGTTTVTNLTASGTVSLPDNSLAIADVSGLQTALDAKVAAASPTLTGTTTVANLTASGTLSFPDASIAQADVAGLVAALAAAALSPVDAWCPGNVMVTRPITATDRRVIWHKATAPTTGGYPNAEPRDSWVVWNG